MIPLGREESQTLEFKSREALAKPAGIARAVVAMLNARGGEIWIGLGEEGSRAARVEPIESPDRERHRLWNHLVDSIEPPPLEEELDLEEVPADSGFVFRIRVAAGHRGPYAHLREGGRFFVMRTGARVRPMTREEILDGAPSRSRRPEEGGALAVLRKEREELLRRKDPTFWLRIQPTIDMDLDVRSEKVERYLRDPSSSGNRVSGWTFADPLAASRFVGSRRVIGDEAKGRTLVDRSGALEHRIPLSWLTHSIDGGTELYPFALLEKIVSVFRLAGALYGDRMPERAHGRDRPVGSRESRRGTPFILADLAMTSARGWTLGAYSPHSAAWLMRHHEKRPHLKGVLETDLLLDRPLELGLDELISRPDACALRLVIQVYEAFGLTDPNMIPSEFDQKAGILHLPS